MRDVLERNSIHRLTYDREHAQRSNRILRPSRRVGLQTATGAILHHVERFRRVEVVVHQLDNVWVVEASKDFDFPTEAGESMGLVDALQSLQRVDRWVASVTQDGPMRRGLAPFAEASDDLPLPEILPRHALSPACRIPRK